MPGADVQLDLARLHELGLLTVPSPVANATAYNAFIQPFIDRYGFVSPTTGAQTGGGLVGFGTQFNDQDFFRDLEKASSDEARRKLGLDDPSEPGRGSPRT